MLHNFSMHLCFTVGDEDDGDDKDVTKVLKHSCQGNLTVCLLSDKLINTFLLYSMCCFCVRGILRFLSTVGKQLAGQDTSAHPCEMKKKM